jgi:GNAT superfamily N-acetyltransferase
VVTRRVAPLAGADVDDLPDTCRGCLFWELGRPRPDPRQAHHVDELAGDPAMQKQAWWSWQVLEQQPPGRVVRVGDKLAAYVLFGVPGTFAPRKAPAPRSSDDALLLATIWVDPTQREGGIGRQLIQAAIKEALRLDLPAVEAYGDRRFREQDCVLPTMWLLHEGFEVHREHPRYPLLRLNTRRAARWTDTLEHALEDIWDLVPKRVPGVSTPTPARDGAPAPQRTTRHDPGPPRR